MQPVAVMCYVGLGSNLDDPVVQVSTALKELDGLESTRLLHQSGLYRSPPMGPQDQPYYVNAVAAIKTSLSPENLLLQLQALETLHGRERSVRWGARTLDLDILLFDDAVICTESLSVPHPGLHQRAFVLYPLHDIAGDIVIPGLGNLTDLLGNCPRDGLEPVEA